MHIKLIFIGLLLALCSNYLLAFESGEDLATAVYNRADGQNSFSLGAMALIEKGKKPRLRQMLTFRLDQDNGDTLSLIRFKKPADIKDTGLLTINYESDKDSDQWIFLPAVKKSRRISSKRQGGRFVGSDIFYEDLKKRQVNKDTHNILRKEKLNGMDTIVLESIPVSEDSSVYDKRISWVHEKTLLPIRIDLYQNGEKKPVKRSLVKQMKKIQGFWTIMKSVTRDLETQHETHIQMQKVFYDQKDIMSDLFTQKYLEDPQREKSLIKQLTN